MNRFLLAMAGASALVIASCQKTEEDLSAGSIKFETTRIVLPDGEEGSTDISFTCEGVKPSAEVAADAAEWLSATLGESKMTVSYAANRTEAERTGTIKVTGGKITPVVITVTQGISDIGTHEYRLGEVTADGKGVIYWVNPQDATNARAISIERKSSMAWGAALEANTGASSFVNGADNTDKLMSMPEAETSFPSAAWCSSLGRGWYLPAFHEFCDIFDIYNGLPHTDPKFIAAIPANLTPEETAARATFDGWLSAAGATSPFNAAAATETGDAYWTSTAEDPNGAYYVKVGEFAHTAFGVKRTSTSRFVRCVKVFGSHTYPGEPALISVGEKSLNLDGTATNTSVSVSVRNGSLKTASSDAAWCTASVTESGVALSIEKNSGTELRTCTVSLVAEATAPDGKQAKANISISQRPFGVEQFKILDLYKENEQVAGIVFWVSPDGMTAKVVSMTRLSNTVWAKKGSTAETTYVVASPSDTDGKANWEAIKSSPMAADIPGVAYIESLGEGWYWPAFDELKALRDAYCGGKPSDRVLPKDLPAAERNAQIAFDKALTDNGGVALNELPDDQSGESYFSSTESKDPSKVKYLRFGSSSNADGGKAGTRFIRAIKEISK